MHTDTVPVCVCVCVCVCEGEEAGRAKHARAPDESSMYPVCWCARERVAGDGGHVSTGLQPTETKRAVVDLTIHSCDLSWCLQLIFDRKVHY